MNSSLLQNPAAAVRVKASPSPGPLDGLTILRFAHAYESGGGVEQYLSDLNAILGRRNRMTTVQIQLTTKHEHVVETKEQCGKSLLARVPLYVEEESKRQAIAGEPDGLAERCKKALRRQLLFAPGVYQTVTRRFLERWNVPKRAGEPAGAGAMFQDLLWRFPINLVVLHASGGADSSEILSIARAARIPAVMVHHFANDRLKSLAISRQILECAGVGGVCGVDVPSHLEKNFCNLSDGIDTDFFRRDKARPVESALENPVVFLPARITPSKGQLDLIRAAGTLHRQGIRFQIVLAGRVESEEFLNALKKQIHAEGLGGCVTFAGQLNAAQLRDWYGTSAVLAFPTHHHEGLPRILLEAQAMELPVVVHDIGGTCEGLIDGETGFLIPEGDQKLLEIRLAQLLQVADLRKQFGRAGRQRVEEKFSLTALAERHEKFYLSVLKR